MGTDAPPQPAGSFDLACAALAERFCEKLAACAPFGFRLLFAGISCPARMRLACVAEATAPDARTTPSLVQQCAGTFAAASCPDFLDERNDHQCYGMGVRANARACGADSQCASGLCRFPPQGCGSCSNRSAAGGQCRRDADCEKPLLCAGGAVCVLPSKLGEACGADRPCAPPYVCAAGSSGPGSVGAKVCRVAARLGDKCFEHEECDFQMGLYCSKPFGATAGTAGTCQAWRFASAGQACGFLAPGGPTACMGSALCLRDPAGREVCMAPGGDGESCGTPQGGRGCVLPAFCAADNVCRLPVPGVCM